MSMPLRASLGETHEGGKFGFLQFYCFSPPVLCLSQQTSLAANVTAISPKQG